MRSIITKKDADRLNTRFISAEPLDEVKPDDFIGRVIKYIPAETVSVYVIIQKTLEQFNNTIPSIISWMLVAVIFIVNLFYLRNMQKIKRLSQIFLSSIAFLIWAYTLGEPFKGILGNNYQAIYSSIAVTLFTFIVPIFKFEKI